MRMNTIMICCSLIAAIFANPITITIDLESPEQQTNSTETLLVAQSSGNGTSDFQSSESESSESVESESSDDTSEESDSVESNETELLVETRDDSMGSEENVRKSWVRVFATVVRDTSMEDNSTEVKGQPESLTKEEQTIQPPTVNTLKQSSSAKVALVQKVTAESDSSSESAESTAVQAFTVDSSQSSSSESNETSSAASDSDSDSASNSAQSSESSEEDSNSRELSPIKDCVNGTQSCESQEYFFQDIGDDANYSVDNLMVPDEDDRELSLRR